MTDRSIQINMLAVSKAGHDKGCTFAVIGEEDNYYFLADGRTRRLEKPKKKKKMHVQPVKDLGHAFPDGLPLAESDADVRRILKVWSLRSEV